MTYGSSGTSSNVAKEIDKRCVICGRTTGHFEEHHPWGRIGADKDRMITVCAGTGGNTDTSSCHGLLHQYKSDILIERHMHFGPADDSHVMGYLCITTKGRRLLVKNFGALCKSGEFYFRTLDSVVKIFTEILDWASGIEGMQGWQIGTWPMSGKEWFELELKRQKEVEAHQIALEKAYSMSADPDNLFGGYEQVRDERGY